LVMPIFILAWFFILGRVVQAATINIETNTVWTKAESPIVVGGNISIKAGVKLTVGSGVVIKLSPNNLVAVLGELDAQGSAIEPVIITSVKDDSAGGDTNGDGNSTAPAQGDWNYLSIGSGGKANLNYTTIRYGGGANYSGAIMSYRGTLNLTNSIITENNAAISLDRGTTTVSHSFIVNNLIPFIGGVLVDAAIANNANANVIVNAADNWWGTAEGPCPWRQLIPPGVPVYQVDIKAICGNKPLVDSGVVYSPWLTQWPEKPAEPDPVILVPGIMGSWNISGRWQIDPIFHTYDNLMEALMAAGYKEDSLSEDKPTLFAFPYDWRQDNNFTANLLKEKIQLVKEITGKDKVDIIAHSMGGLVTRSYVEGSDYQNDIDQVVFLGTPHLGSPQGYLRYGGAVFIGQWAWLQKYLFQTEAALSGYFDLTDYIRVKVPSVEQLLPIFGYLKDKQPDNSWQLRNYPLNYPENSYLENLNGQAKVDLLKTRVKITNIVSDLSSTSTLNYLKVIADPDKIDNKWQSGYPENLDKNLDSLEMGNGDDTVPFVSANGLSDVETIETTISGHTNLPTVMQKEIIRTLTGKEPADYFNNKITATIKRWYFFRVYSPVDFSVVTPNGKKIGKDFINNAEFNEVPDAFYSGFNDSAEFILIPNPEDGEYKIEVQGVDNGGKYTLANSIIDDDKEISKEYSGSITPGQLRNFTIDYSAALENPLSDLKPVDTVSPVVVINSPIESNKYFRSDTLNIDYSATDDFSGIDTTIITIDNQTIATTTVSLFDYSLGQHNLIVQAFDKSGSQTEEQVMFEIIANIDSTILDIKEIYARGWLSSQVYKILLIDAFKLLTITIKSIDDQITALERLIEKTQANSNLKPNAKQKLINQYNNMINNLKITRQKTIFSSLDIIIKTLDISKKLRLINQSGYDIIINDINYLRVNL
jgi:pimeloyl-ACP methyl ester carboxylesterase